MNRKLLLAVIGLSIIEAINQYVLFFTLHIVLDAILEKIVKAMLTFIADMNTYIRIKRELSFSMSAVHWEEVSLLFLLYFFLMSTVRFYFVAFKKDDPSANNCFKKYIYSVFVGFLFFVGGYIYIIVLNHSIYKSNPYEAPFGILLAFFTPYLYYKAIGVIRCC